MSSPLEQPRMKRRGGPLAHPELCRTRIIPVRMTDKEYAAAKACSDALGISLSRLMRSRTEALPASIIDLAAARELGRIGANLNQAVRLIHAGLVHDLNGVHEVVMTLKGEIDALRERLRS